MDDRARDAGQRLSPLTLMPLAILGSAVLCDLGAMVGGVSLFGVAAFYNMAAGLLTGFVALVIVLVDLVTTPSGSASRELVGTVGAAMTAMTGVFALVWYLRWSDRDGRPLMVLIEVLALAVGAVGVWFAQGVVIGRQMRQPVQVPTPASVPSRVATPPLISYQRSGTSRP